MKKDENEGNIYYNYFEDDHEANEYRIMFGFDDNIQKTKSNTYRPDFPIRRALGLVCLIVAVVKIIVWLNS